MKSLLNSWHSPLTAVHVSPLNVYVVRLFSRLPSQHFNDHSCYADLSAARLRNSRIVISLLMQIARAEESSSRAKNVNCLTNDFNVFKSPPLESATTDKRHVPYAFAIRRTRFTSCRRKINKHYVSRRLHLQAVRCMQKRRENYHTFLASSP